MHWILGVICDNDGGQDLHWILGGELPIVNQGILFGNQTLKDTKRYVICNKQKSIR